MSTDYTIVVQYSSHVCISCTSRRLGWMFKKFVTIIFTLDGGSGSESHNFHLHIAKRMQIEKNCIDFFMNLILYFIKKAWTGQLTDDERTMSI